MLRQTIDILTSYTRPKKLCAMGNVAIARGAIEAGVKGVFSYPGTPSTEISEVFKYVDEFQGKKENEQKYPEQTAEKIYFEYSINEKIALEKAIAFSIGNRSALCVMKNVGLNVASDALMSIPYQLIVAPLVIVVCDDPGCHSSSNEQDSRHWGPMASVPVFDPATPADALLMVKEAFLLSAELHLPVIVRTTTRVSHSRGIIRYGELSVNKGNAGFNRLPEHINIPARTAAAHTRLLAKLNQKQVHVMQARNSRRLLNGKKARLGIICSGVCSAYLLEILHSNDLADKVCVLETGMIHPFPEKQVLKFLKRDLTKILVLEELDPYIENNVRLLLQKQNISRTVLGKGFAGLLSTGEYSLDLISAALRNFMDIRSWENTNTAPEGYESFLSQIPPRPPTLCAGCPHRATFYLLKLAIPREQPELILCGDIGCFGLGALPPLKMIDTINHMGMSISMAQGLHEAFRSTGDDKKIVALVGDGTFFHSGLASLVNAVYTRANILVVIFDNRTTGMTGHQGHPGASTLPKYKELDIPRLLNGMGISEVEVIDPFSIRDSFHKLNKAMAYQGVSVVVAKAPCIFLPQFKEGINRKLSLTVDENKCNTCGNHEDPRISCSRDYSPLNNLSRARAKLLAGISIPAEEQLCPANICNHGFFNAILEGDARQALAIVRDKMLFARACGDICHRPCELFSDRDDVVPVKALKNYVSSIEENFRDFSEQQTRVKNADLKYKSVAVIGAGPAGLSAAYDLVQAGYKVSVFEKEEQPGGLVAHVIPDFRMDKAGYVFEASRLQELGVEFHFKQSLGRDFSLQKLSNTNDAVIIAIGLHRSKTIDLIEKNLPDAKRSDALCFLREFNRKQVLTEPPSVFLVIGGGNSAVDTARAAKKLNPVNKVMLVCIESESAMPAFTEEIKHAKDEGIEFITDCYAGTCTLSTTGQVEIGLHNAGNREFKRMVTCDHVITAIGQESDRVALAGMFEDHFDPASRLSTHSVSRQYKNVFVAGDLSSGNHMSVIGAIASGKKAAISVRQLLEEYPYAYEGSAALERLNKQTPIHTRPVNTINKQNLETVVRQFDLHQACMKCNHCIDNFGCPAMVKVNGKVQINMSRCNLCGLCIDVCPNNAISWATEELKTAVEKTKRTTEDLKIQ